MSKPYLVPTAWDPDAKVWVATSDDVPGLVAEAGSIEALETKLSVLIPELLQANACMPADGTIRIELVVLSEPARQ